MPLTINVGLVKKLGEANYGSRGASVNLELELDSSLAQDATKLQEKIRQLFSLVRASLQEELNGGNGSTHTPASNGDGASQPATPFNKPRQATQSQIKALYAITKSRRLDLAVLLRTRFNASRPEDLTIKEASQLIDSLKSTNGKEG